MSHFTSDGREVHIVHTWRDGSYIYKGEFGADLEKVGAVAVGGAHDLQKVVEFRHLKGQGADAPGELFEWERDDNGGWDWQHFGEYTERFLIKNDFTI